VQRSGNLSRHPQPMSIRGVRQLKGLTLRYCDWGGSSRGARAFIQDNLIEWATKNPAVEVTRSFVTPSLPPDPLPFLVWATFFRQQIETVIKRNHHPVVIGEYGTNSTMHFKPMRTWQI